MPAPDPLPKHIYKLITKADAPSGPLPATLPLSPVDAKDNFIHFSTAAQVPSTASRFFPGTNELVLVRFSLAALQKKQDAEMRWDESPSGRFPHLHGKLSIGHEEADGLITVEKSSDIDWHSKLADGSWENDF